VYEQFDDVCAGMDCIGRKLVDFDVDFTRIYMVAESAGAYLATYVAAMKKSKALQDAIGYEPTRMKIRAMGLICGMFYTTRHDALGRFLYLLDAAMDLDDDVAHGSYNPFRTLSGQPDNEERFRDILRMHLGECVYWFDMLPLVEDVGLMKNILCVGLWSAFNQKYSQKYSEEGPEDGSGSV
jgi:hypothetical protein